MSLFEDFFAEDYFAYADADLADGGFLPPLLVDFQMVAEVEEAVEVAWGDFLEVGWLRCELDAVGVEQRNSAVRFG